MTVVAAALVIVASGCYVGEDSPASEEGTAVAGEAGAVVSDGEGALPAASAAAPSDDEIAALDPPDAAASDEASDEAPDLVQRVVGAVSPLVGLLIDAFTGDETIEIGAFCNSRWDWAVDELRGPETLDDCRASAEGGIRIGKGWAWEFWGAGFENTSPDPSVDGPRLIDTTQVVVSINDGPPIPFNDPTFIEAMNTLAPGRHTIRMNEWQEGDAWAGWTGPHVFTVVAELEVVALCNVTLDPLLDEEPALDDWQGPATTAECRAAAEAGLHTGEGWWWRDSLMGVVELDNVEYRFDGDHTVARRSLWGADSGPILRLLGEMAPGRHTAEIRELRPWGWTDWSAPYEFETIAVLRIIAICTLPADGSEAYSACKGAESGGFDRSLDWWNLFAEGVVEWENVAYRFDGGVPTLEGGIIDLWKLPPGTHTVEIREQRPWGWTDWSPPYAFTVR